MPPARILLVDDHMLFTEGLAGLIERESDWTVTGRVADGLQVLEAVREQEPDVVVMDLTLPGLNGIEATRQIAAERPKVKVLCLSMHSEPRYVEEALVAGANGYIVKDEAFEEVGRAIRAVLAGRTFLGTAVAGNLVTAWKADRSPTQTSAYGLLSERERQVLKLVAEGHSTREIAERLHVGEKTVGSHREHVMQKTGIRNVAGLTKYAVAEGLTDLETGRRGTDPEA